METVETRLTSEGLHIRKDLHKLDITRTKIDKKTSKYCVKSVFSADKNIERIEGKHSFPSNTKLTVCRI